MPAGFVHDRITLISLPVVGGLTLAATRSASQTLGLCAAFLFSGFMFGPDLDIYSCQFCRWGPARIIWIPYQRLFKHRSWGSHGLLIGTTVRVIYLLLWVGLGSGVVWVMLDWLNWAWSWQSLAAIAQTSWRHHAAEYLAVLAGLELGAMSHSLSDWLGSAFKSYRRPRSATRGSSRSKNRRMP